MSNTCCKNPIGFIRNNCTALNSLIDNLDAIINAAGSGPLSGVTCAQAIVCIQDAINSGGLTLPDNDTVPIGGTFDPASGVARIELSDGNFVTLAQWPVAIAPIEALGTGGAIPTPAQLDAAAVGAAPGTILWNGGTQEDPVHAWTVSAQALALGVPTGNPIITKLK